MQRKDGTRVERTKGTPQGGVISPLLANLFLHYAFDHWMGVNFPNHPWARYADDGVVHCRTEWEAKDLLEKLTERFQECGLELHPEKTRIIYCKDKRRRGNYPQTKFDFLGYTFRPRLAMNRNGRYFVNFLPAISNKAAKAIRRTVHDWRIHLKSDMSLIDLSRIFNPIIRGWIEYYSRFYKTALRPTLKHLNCALIHWARRKFKRFRRSRRRAERWLGRIAQKEPWLFAHWKMGVKPTAG